MTATKIESADLHECENALDANWNERKRLIETEFDLRLQIQELLIKGDLGFQKVRETELICKNALRRNDEEYESLVSKWAAEVAAK